MNKNIIIILMSLMLSLSSQAVINRLISPNQGSIIDIGSNKPISKADVIINKDWINIAANLARVNPVIYPKRRDETIKNCIYDKYGVGNCPIGLATCQEDNQYNPGYSTEHFSTKYAAKISHVFPTNAPGFRYGNAYPEWSYFLGREYGVANGHYHWPFYAEQAGIYTVRFQVDNYGSLNIDGKHSVSRGDGSWKTSTQSLFNIHLPIGLHYVNISSGGDHHTDGVAATVSYKGHVIWNSRTGQTVSICPNGYVNNGSNCSLDYKWYSYSCPSDNQYLPVGVTHTWDSSNPNGMWLGPLVSTGGDCNGKNLDSNKACQSSTPPAHNCLRRSFTCPVDGNQHCTQIPDKLGTGTTNKGNGFIYDNGFSIGHNEVLIKNKSCPTGMVLNSKDNVCVTANKYSCTEKGFRYDSTLGQCVKIPQCTGFDNKNGDCITKAKVNCSAGYSFNSLDNKCEKIPFCDKGIYNTITKKCEESAAQSGCQKGFTFNKVRARCELSPIIKHIRNVCPFVKGKNTYNSTQEECIYKKESGFHGDWLIWPNHGSIDGSKSKIISNLSYNAQVYHNGYDMYKNGWQYNGKFAMKLYNYGSGCGGFSVSPTPDKIVVLVNGGSSVVRRGYINSCTQLISSGNAKYATVLGIWNQVPKSINFNCDDYCLVSKPSSIIGYLSCPAGFTAHGNICEKTPECPTGYTWNYSYNTCYIDKNPIHEDFGLNVYWSYPTCPGGGTFNPKIMKCQYGPSCTNGGTFNLTRGVCQLSPKYACNSDQTFFHSQVLGYENACQKTNNCPSGSFLKNFGLNNNLCVGGKIPSCKKGQTFNIEKNRCEEAPTCPVNYREDKNGKCEKAYTWYDYFCKQGWTGPDKPGLDCKGNCGLYGCSCEPKNPLPNNCRKPLSQVFQNETIKKRPLIDHKISGNDLTPKEFGDYKGYQCGKDCQFVVDSITGKGNQLCFHKKNGENTCFKVDNCNFYGKINNPNGIKELQIGKEIRIEPKTNTYVFIAAPNKGFDYSVPASEEHGRANFTKFGNDWKSAGFSLARTALKLSDGNWYVEASIANNDSRGCGFSNRFKVLPDSDYHVIKYSKICYAGTNFVPHGCAEKIAITLPKGLHLVAMSDIESVSANDFKTAACNSDNAYDEEYQIYKEGFPNESITVSRNGFGVEGSQNIDIQKKINSLLQGLLRKKSFYQYILAEGSDSSNLEMGPNNTIHSTCKMNGHVGSFDSKTGIVSIKKGSSLTQKEIQEINKERGEISNLNDTSYYDPNDRLEFWDPYQGQYLGFIEFVKGISNKDRQDGYGPKSRLAYNLGQRGFTAISELNGYTYFVSLDTIGVGMSNQECNNYASEFHLERLMTFNVEENKLLKRLAGDRQNERCILRTPDMRQETFNASKYAFKVEKVNGGYSYKCSKYKCAAGQCKLETCPAGYQGNLISPDITLKNNECTGQTCDGNKPYLKVCGKEIGCPKGPDYKKTESTTGPCYRYVCHNGGTLNLKNKTCKKFECPDNTHEVSDGTCRRN